MCHDSWRFGIQIWLSVDNEEEERKEKNTIVQRDTQ